MGYFGGSYGVFMVYLMGIFAEMEKGCYAGDAVSANISQLC